MKYLFNLLLASMFLLIFACSNDEMPNDVVQPDAIKPSTALSDEQIKEKIALFYESPSVYTNPMNLIKSEFNKQFPKASDAEWEYSNGIYEVDFEINGVDFEAWYDESAILLMYKYDIRVSELPSAVKTAIQNDYPGYNMLEAKKVLKGTIVGYLVELKKGRTEIEVYYKEDGMFIAHSIYESKNKPGGETGTTNSEPPINTGGSYTDEQIDELLAQYYAAHSKDVTPGASLTAEFKKHFPTVRDVEWEVANNIYNVDFEVNNIDYEAWYTTEGFLLMYSYEIRQLAIPEVVKNAVSTKYTGYLIDDVEKIFKGTIIGYTIELEKGPLTVDALFKEDGTFLSEYRR